MRRIINFLLHCTKSPWVLVLLYNAFRHKRLILNSEYFDWEWIVSQYTSPSSKKNFLISYFLDDSGRIDTSRDFIASEYKMIHGIDTRFISPLLHYEKTGKHLGYVISYRDLECNGGKKEGCRKHITLSSETLENDHNKTVVRLQKKLRKGNRLRVVFFVFNASMFPAKPLFRKMLLDVSYDPRIIVIPDFRYGKGMEEWMSACYNELSSAFGKKYVIKASRDINFDWIDYLPDADIVYYSTPYEVSDVRYNPRWVLHYPVLSFYINYSYIVAKFSLMVYRQETFASFWRVFLESQNALLEYSANSVSEGRNGTVVGYLKMDELHDFINGDDMSRRKRIIVAPHHSFKGGFNDVLAISNFLRFADLFLALPRKYPGIDFVFRPHPYLRLALENNSVWGKCKTDEYFEKMASFSNVRISIQDYMEEFVKSDAIIQDCGSFLAEYFYTGKPQCYMLRSENDIDRAFTPFGCECINNCYKAFTDKDILNFIDKVVVDGEDVKKEPRDVFAKKVMCNYPFVADKILDYIKAEAMYR